MAGVFFPRDEFIRLGLSKPAVDALQKVLAIAAVEADQDALSVIVADLMAALGVAEGEIDALQAAMSAAEAAIAALVLVDVDLQGQIDAIAADALGGTVTSITAGVGLDGGVITGVGTIDLADTAVTAGVYGDASNVPQITVDAQGRITDVVEVAVSGGGGGSSPEASFVKPAFASFAWRNQGTASGADGVNALILTTPTSAGAQMRALEQTPPAATFTLTARVVSNGIVTGASGNDYGLFVRNATSGRIVTFGFTRSSTAAARMPIVSNWTTETAFSANLYAPAQAFGADINWLRIVVDATNLTFFASYDGFDFFQVHTAVTLASYINAAGGTLDRAGLFSDKLASAGLACQSFEFT
jgi:hypothetical protein